MQGDSEGILSTKKKVSDEVGNTAYNLKTNINEFLYLLISQTQAG